MKFFFSQKKWCFSNRGLSSHHIQQTSMILAIFLLDLRNTYFIHRRDTHILCFVWKENLTIYYCYTPNTTLTIHVKFLFSGFFKKHVVAAHGPLLVTKTYKLSKKVTCNRIWNGIIMTAYIITYFLTTGMRTIYYLNTTVLKEATTFAEGLKISTLI